MSIDITGSSESDEEILIQTDWLYRYGSRFIQRKPAYGVKDGDWRTEKRTLEDSLVIDHVHGRVIIGTYARWYPEYAILDIDGHGGMPKTLADVNDIKKLFGIESDRYSITYMTSPGSYHVIWKPRYNGEPVTISLLHMVLGAVVKAAKIELYPQAKRVIRAPFHPACRIVGRSGLPTLETIEDKLDAFDGLDYREISEIAEAHRWRMRTIAQTVTDPRRAESVAAMKKNRRCAYVNPGPLPKPSSGCLRMGADLYMNGLTSMSTRFESQKYVAMHLYRQNLTMGQAVDELLDWLRTRHNGFSKDAKAMLSGNWKVRHGIQREHISIVEKVWYELDKWMIFPNSTHNTYNGWFTEADILTAAKHSGGNIPLLKFLAQMLAYFNAFGKTRLNVHSKKLIGWSSSQTYIKHLDALIASGFLEREDHYLKGEFPKTIMLKVKPSFQDPKDGYMDDDRALTLDETFVKMGRLKVYELLTRNGVSRQNAHQFVERRMPRRIG